MTNVLYIGNALAQKGNTSTTIDTLGDQLSEFCNVSIASNKSNKILRLLDMVWSVIKFNKRTDYVLIDTYSTHNFYYALVVSQFCRLLRIKYIPILHGGNLEKRLIKKIAKATQMIMSFSPLWYVATVTRRSILRTFSVVF